MPALITNNHLLNEDDIKINKDIEISFYNDKIIKILKINDSRKIYTNENLDITIIEIITME